MKKYLYTFLATTFSLVLTMIVLAPVQRIEASSITLDTISPSTTVSAGTAISFQINANGFYNPYYLVSDSLPGSTLSNSNISTRGLFTWTPSHTDTGTHVITLIVVDSNGVRSSMNQTLIVNPATSVSVQNLSPGASIFPDPLRSVSFSVSAGGYVNPKFYVSDSFANSSISNSNINADGNFGWTPKLSDIGVHNISVRVVSGNRTDTTYQTITVNGVSIQNVSGHSTTVGTPLTFTLVPFGFSNPTYRITDSKRNNTLDDSNISSNYFSWTPKEQDIGTHAVVITAVSSDGHTVSIPITLEVYVNTTFTTPVTTQPSNPQLVAVAKYVFTKALSVGSTGTEVTELQKKLKADGFYTGPITGTFGPLAKTALMKYQKAKGLSQVGVVGPATRIHLNK